MNIRKVTKKELRTVIKLHQYAYGFWSDQEVKEEDFEYMEPEDTFGLFEDDELVSVLTVLKVQQSIRGVLKGLGGISMVGTYPEARTKGYIRALMQTVFLEMKEKGIAVSMLEPFKETFYAKFGYVPAYSRFRLTAPFDGLRVPPNSIIGSEWEFERVRGVMAKESYLEFVSDFAPSHYHGFAFNPDISDAEWKRRNKNRLFVFVKKKGKIEALLRYQIKGYMHFEEEGQFIINEMYWRNIKAQAALFNYLGKHKDQFTKVKMWIPYGTNFQQWFTDLKEFVEVKTWNPWMVRVIDVKEALKDLPAPTEGDIIIKVTDPQCDWNNGTFSLQSKSNRIQIATTKRVPTVEISIEGLSALVYGTHSLEFLEFTGQLKISDEKTRQTLQQWFPQLLLYNPYTY